MMCLGFKKYGKPTANFASRRLVGLSCFSDLLQETEHFCRWPQKQVAKIVQCGEQNIEEDASARVTSTLRRDFRIVKTIGAAKLDYLTVNG
jgi:hypothetical protein